MSIFFIIYYCYYFYPRPPRGGRPYTVDEAKAIVEISIHALREEGDLLPCLSTVESRKFLSTPSARRATPSVRRYGRAPAISIHALREEGDKPDHEWPGIHVISIHALREEGDRHHPGGQRLHKNFYPRPPRGGRHFGTDGLTFSGVFLSTPSARRATTGRPPRTSNMAYFYPRPPRGGRPSSAGNADESAQISIHALREEGDAINQRIEKRLPIFLSTPSARRATHGGGKALYFFCDFYPRPPRGGRPER